MGITFSKGSELNNSIFGKSQEPIKMFLESKVESFQNNSVIKDIFMMEKSDTFGEKFTSMTSMSGFMPTGEGGAYPVDEMQEGYSKFLEHETWKDSFKITQEMVEDNKLLSLKGKPTQFINGYGRTRERFGAALLGGAVSGTSAVFGGKSYSTACADGQAMFATAHPAMVSGAAQSNKYADPFSNDALVKAECAMQNFRDDNGNILSLTPNTIIIPNEATIKKNVFAAIGADKDPNTANNGFNYTFGRWNVIVWSYLNQFLSMTASVPWFLCDTVYNEESGGAIWLDRKELAIKSYIDENTDDNIWKGRARFIAGFNDWRAFMVGGAASGTTL